MKLARIEEHKGVYTLWFGKELLTAGYGVGVKERFEEIVNLINVGRV